MDDAIDKKFDFEKINWLHIWGSWTYHSEARIRGTKLALTAMRDAINDALEKRSAVFTACASDGEGYSVVIERINSHSSLGEAPYVEIDAERAARELVQYQRNWPRYSDQIETRLYNEAIARVTAKKDTQNG